VWFENMAEEGSEAGAFKFRFRAGPSRVFSFLYVCMLIRFHRRPFPWGVIFRKLRWMETTKTDRRVRSPGRHFLFIPARKRKPRLRGLLESPPLAETIGFCSTRVSSSIAAIFR